MSAAEKVAFCREWFARGECPGCGAGLADVAGQGLVHYRRRSWRGSDNRWAERGETVPAVGIAGREFPAFCSWDADDLTSLVLIGSGTVLDGGADAPAHDARPGFTPPAPPSMSATGEVAGSPLPAAVTSPVVPEA